MTNAQKNAHNPVTADEARRILAALKGSSEAHSVKAPAK